MMVDSGFGFALLLCVLCFGGLLALAGLVFALVKLGVIAGYWGKPAPTDSGDQTLAQSREAGKVEPAAPPQPEAKPEDKGDGGPHI